MNFEMEHTLTSIRTGYDQLKYRADLLRREQMRLEQADIAQAGIHWRKNRQGEKTILELVYAKDSARVRSGQRRIEYIGQDPEKQQAALARLERFREWRDLGHSLHNLEGKLSQIERALSQLARYVNGEQTHFHVY